MLIENKRNTKTLNRGNKIMKVAERKEKDISG